MLRANVNQSVRRDAGTFAHDRCVPVMFIAHYATGIRTRLSELFLRRIVAKPLDTAFIHSTGLLHSVREAMMEHLVRIYNGRDRRTLPVAWPACRRRRNRGSSSRCASGKSYVSSLF